MQENPRTDNGAMDIPDYAIQRIARCLLPRLLAYFESEEGQRELASGNSNTTADHSDVSRAFRKASHTTTPATEVTTAAYRKRMTYDHEQRNQTDHRTAASAQH